MGDSIADVAELAKGGRLKICSIAVHRFESGRRHHTVFDSGIMEIRPVRGPVFPPHTYISKEPMLLFA